MRNASGEEGVLEAGRGKGKPGTARKISQSTAKVYMGHVRTLHHAACMRLQIPPLQHGPAPLNACELMNQWSHSDVSRSTSAGCRAALLYYLSLPATLRRLVVDDPMEIERAKADLRKCPNSETYRFEVLEEYFPFELELQGFDDSEPSVSNWQQPQSSRRQGIKKPKKSISENDLERLCAELKRMSENPRKLDSPDPVGANLLLNAMIASGGRPSEVFNISWASRAQWQVRLQNLKRRRGTQHKDGLGRSAIGEFERRLESQGSDVFEVVTDQEIDSREFVLDFEASALSIDAWIQHRDGIMLGSQPPTQEAFYQRIKKAMQAANRSAFGRIIYNFYTARHQFASNSKVIHEREEVSRRLGHNPGSSTAMRHYARRSAAHGAYKETALQRATAVKEGNDQRRPRMTE